MKTQLQQDEALIAFGRIKDLYADKINELTELKRQLFHQSDQALDQQLRSRLRITIESLLIDLNEEVFAISEELAKSFTFERNKQFLGAKAAEYEQRQQHILKKIKESVDQNAVVKKIRRGRRIKEQSNLSPTQVQSKDLSTFGVGSIESERAQVSLPMNSIRNPSPQVHKKLQRQNSSNQKQSSKKQPKYNPVELFQVVSTTRDQNSLKKRKSPIPLRRKDLNASLTHKQEGDVILQRSASKSRYRRSQSASKKHLTRIEDSHRINQTQLETLQSVKNRRSAKRLEDFESFLQKKFTKRKEFQNSEHKKGKENVLQMNKSDISDNQDKNELLGSLVLQSEAFQLFTQDFAFMKNRMIQMQNRMNEQEEKTRNLEEQISKIKTENVKLNADVRILTAEQQDLIDTVRALD